MRAQDDPAGFAYECEDAYSQKVCDVANAIAEHIVESHVVFLSGPSSSGKTTTAKRICTELERHSIHAYTISMDNYFIDFNPETAPRTESGDFDFESPDCLDFELLSEHAQRLDRGEEILKPFFNFKTQSRDPSRAVRIKLKEKDVLIFEGIHALNDRVSGGRPCSLKLFVNAESDIMSGGDVMFERSWLRLMRRVVRDERYRGTGVCETLKMWPDVRRGEVLYIDPFKHKANITIDTSLPYEVSVMKQFVQNAFESISAEDDPSGELVRLVPALCEFEEIKPEYVPPESILREFFGGGIYDY